MRHLGNYSYILPLGTYDNLMLEFNRVDIRCAISHIRLGFQFGHHNTIIKQPSNASRDGSMSIRRHSPFHVPQH
jgi:hypothetical protein